MHFCLTFKCERKLEVLEVPTIVFPQDKHLAMSLALPSTLVEEINW